MYNIVFVCYGNICRSPMAEMIFKNLVYQHHKRYLLSCISRATSMEEIGSDIYPKAKEKLLKEGIPIEKHVAKQINAEDYEKYDLIIIMENSNKTDLLKIFKGDPQNKIHFLMEYTDHNKEIADPWYSNDFETAYSEIYEGCVGLFNYLLKTEDKNEI